TMAARARVPTTESMINDHGFTSPPPTMHELVSVQYQYHRRLFPALHDWERTERAILEFTEGSGPSGLLGLDQMGHFGPPGCDLVADAIRGALPDSPLTFCELGSGFGGALRYIVDRLVAGGIPVSRAYGIDLVPEHCAASRRISAKQGRSMIAEICASATDVPLEDAALDAVIVTGSMPHFPRPDEVLREAARMLRPGGLLVVTEEVSLTPGFDGPSRTFREVHPREVFFTTPVAERLDQLRAAGFTSFTRRDLRDWAIALIEDRLKLMRIFRGAGDKIYGKESVELILRTLATARDEYATRRLLPVLLTARAAE
ncbi:class I SAM-dependent methyltransferase, partial [Streptomyces sp. NPDC005728]|uniref:class I SAM-dependent methyltransferase n=1 Tax=Streptomyces sp. NPDC005728 TaxID=3157054 RepID=UPI0033EABB7D